MGARKNACWAAAGVIGSVTLAATGTPAAVADPAVPGSTGSADVVLSLRDGVLELDLGPGAAGPGSGRTADLEVGPGARTTVPEVTGYGFLGRPGDPVWILGGAVSEDDMPRWDTSGVPADVLTADGGVEWALTGIEGPGDVAVFEPPADGATGDGSAEDGKRPRLLFDSADGLPDSRILPSADSGELAWAFSEPGEYRITSEAAADLASGTTSTARAEWNVRVTAEGGDSSRPPGDTDPADPAPPAGPPPPPDSAATRQSDIATEKVVIDDGHVDAIAGRMVNGRLRTLFKDSRDSGDIVWREPSSVVMHVVPEAREQIPAGGAYDFLGAAGSDFWLVPQVQKDGVIWAGWNTESLDGGDLDGPVDMRLTKVSGPGELAVWSTAGLGGAEVLYNSRDGLPDSRKVGLGVHAHANWGFSKEGVYKVTLRLGGTKPNGQATSDTRTYTFVVGDDVDPGTVTPGGGSADGGSTGGTGTGGGSGSGAGGDGGGSSGPVASDGDGGSMAHTGSGPVAPLAGGAAVLVLGGVAAVFLSRPRRRRTVATAGGDVPS